MAVPFLIPKILHPTWADVVANSACFAGQCLTVNILVTDHQGNIRTSVYFEQTQRWQSSARPYFLTDDVFAMNLLGINNGNGGPILFDIATGTLLDGLLFPKIAQPQNQAHVQNNTYAWSLDLQPSSLFLVPWQSLSSPSCYNSSLPLGVINSPTQQPPSNVAYPQNWTGPFAATLADYGAFP